MRTAELDRDDTIFFFFENDNGDTHTDNEECCDSLITNLSDEQDNGACQTTRANLTLLREKVSGQVISRPGLVNWALRSCNCWTTRETVFMRTNLQLLKRIEVCGNSLSDHMSAEVFHINSKVQTV